MTPIRRDQRGSSRHLGARMGLYFLGAGLWIGGVLTGQSVATGVAIVVLVAAFLLGRFGGREEQP